MLWCCGVPGLYWEECSERLLASSPIVEGSARRGAEQMGIARAGGEKEVTNRAAESPHCPLFFAGVWTSLIMKGIGAFFSW